MLRYYLYVSDTKVDMLFSQIPTKLAKRISAELELDFQIISVRLKSETQDETRYSKLKVVEEYLRRHENVGSVEQPGSYFSGTASLVFTVVDTTAVFCGKERNTMLGLTGSARHLTGNAGTPATVSVDSISHLALPSVARALGKMSDEAEADVGLAGMEPASALAFVVGRVEGRAAQAVDFLARTMHREDVTTKDWGEAYRTTAAGISQLLLGSPLYVSLPS